MSSISSLNDSMGTDQVKLGHTTRSFKTTICGTFVRRMRKDVRYCFDKNHNLRPWCRS